MTKGTHPLIDDEAENRREYGLFWGIVVENKDPAERGRVRIKMPGLTEASSTWAEAVGNPGQGGGKHGLMVIPKVGATVLVGFIQGDFNSPVYWGGPPPSGQQPDGQGPNSLVLQTDTFRFVVFEEEGQEKKIRIETLLPGATDDQKAVAKSFIEITTMGGDRGNTHAVRIHSGSALSITAIGGIEIDAPIVNIKGRAVKPTTDGI